MWACPVYLAPTLLSSPALYFFRYYGLFQSTKQGGKNDSLPYTGLECSRFLDNGRPQGIPVVAGVYERRPRVCLPPQRSQVGPKVARLPGRAISLHSFSEEKRGNPQTDHSFSVTTSDSSRIVSDAPLLDSQQYTLGKTQFRPLEANATIENHPFDVNTYTPFYSSSALLA